MQIVEPAGVGSNGVPTGALTALDFAAQSGLGVFLVGSGAVHDPERETGIVVLDVLHRDVIVLEMLLSCQCRDRLLCHCHQTGGKET